MDNHEIPIWWEVVSLSEVSNKLVDGSHNPPAKQSVGFPMLSAVNINNNQILFSEYRLVSEEAFSLEDRRTRIEPGDVLLTIVGAIGRTAVVSETTPKFTLQRSVAVITPRHISSKFLMYQFESPRITRYFQKNARGTAQKGVYLKTLGNTEIWLPPLNEQHRIVAKIEALFSELEKGIESFKTAREQLKIYRQALLKHAFSGKLTEQWRAENAGKLESAEALLQRIQTERQQRYQQQLKDWEQSKSPPTPLLQRGETGPSTGKENAAAATTPSITTDAVIPPFEKGGLGGIFKPKPPKTLPPLTAEELAELPELPDGWAWAKVADLSIKITDGEHFRPQTHSEGIYFLSAKDVQDHGVVFDDPLFIDEETAAKARLRCDPERNDILIVSRGATVGRMCIVKTHEIFCLLGSVILIKALKAIDSNYFLYGLKSPLVNKRIIDASGATAQQAIYLRDIQHVPIPLCSVSEQLEIAKILEEKLSIIDELEKTLDSEISHSEALRQSILQKAFSGQLVPQDPNDEPAGVLLERIRAEQTVLSAQPKVAKNKRNKP